MLKILDFEFYRKKIGKGDCYHKHIELDPEGDIVICRDCGLQVSAFYALDQIVKQWSIILNAIESQRAELEREKQKHLHLLAAKKVERAWRNKNMVPCCPHCMEPIYPSDGFGNHLVSKGKK